MFVAQALEETVSRFPDKPAVICGEEVLTFKALNSKASLLASVLRKQGLKKGQRLALLLKNSPLFVLGYLSAMKLGAIAVLVDLRAKGRELEEVLVNAQVNFLMAETEKKRDIKALGSLPPSLREVIWADESLEEHVRDDGSLQPLPPLRLHGDSEALYLYTSGTTGKPKGVVLTYDNLSCFPQTMGKVIGTSEKDTVGCLLPMSHISGPVLCNEAIDKASTLVIFDQYKPEALLDTIERRGVTWFHTVPSIFQLLLKVSEPERYSLKSLRMAALMGTTVPVSLMKEFHSRYPHVAVIQGYGLTETSPLVTLTPTEGFERKMASCGKAVPGAVLKVVDDPGQEVPSGEVGELIVKGPQVMKGYHHDPEATREILKNGWFYTGDLAKVDDEGYYYIVGRKKDLIITGGLNLYPAEVESVLMEHPKVKEAVVFGVPDKKKGEVVKAVVVLKEPMKEPKRDLLSFLRERLAPYKVPKVIQLRDSLPKTETGKVIRALLREEEVS